MSRRIGSATVILILGIGAFLLWAPPRKSGTPPPPAAPAQITKSDPAPEARAGRSEENAPSLTPPADGFVLKRWSDIRPDFAYRSAPGMGSEFSLLVEGLRIGRMRGGWSEEEVDAVAREVGVLAAIDLAVLKSVGWDHEGTVENDFHLPGGYASRAKKPEDPEKLRAALVKLVSGDTAEALSRIRESHRCEGAELGIRCRAIAWLTSLGPSSQSTRFLNELLANASEPSLRGLAAAGLLKHGEEAIVNQWTAGESDSVARNAFLAAIAPERGAASFKGPRMPAVLAQMFESASDPTTRRLAAVAMAGRMDDPALRARVVGIVDSDQDPDLKLSVIQKAPVLLDDPTYRAALLSAARSGDRKVALAALRQLGTAKDPETAQVLIGRLESDDLHVARAAAEMLNMCGSASPRESKEALERALKKHGGDEAFEFYAISALNRLR